jgi:hypothetical protein
LPLSLVDAPLQWQRAVTAATCCRWPARVGWASARREASSLGYFADLRTPSREIFTTQLSPATFQDNHQRCGPPGVTETDAVSRRERNPIPFALSDRCTTQAVIGSSRSSRRHYCFRPGLSRGLPLTTAHAQ